jgi:hypothetical protein
MNIRRVYVYVVTAVTLNAVAWALIALLRNILTPILHREQSFVVHNIETMALQLAIIIIGLPIYLVHWLWTERLAQRDEEERQATLRGLYLYVMLTAFLTPFIANAYSFVQAALRLILGVKLAIPTWSSELPSEDTLLFTLIAMLVLALLGGYHMWVIRSNRRTISDTATQDTIHRLYIYLFSFVGLVMTSVGVGNMLRWLLFRVGETAAVSTNEQSLITASTELLVGIPVWLVFWWQAERMFNQGGNVEQASALRKFYLYLVIFLAALGTVGSLTTLLAGLFRRLFSLESQGDVRNVLSVLITTAVIWAYHFVVLRQDTKAMPEGQPQAGVRRLYWYLIAGIGLMVLLVGIGGDISVFIRSLSGQDELFMKNFLLEQLAWFTATLIAGLALWSIPWRNIQAECAGSEPGAAQARQSWVRKIYLYFYLLLATLTFLGAGIYILSQLVLLVIGGRAARTLVPDMAQAIAFALLAVAVWSYHLTLIRRNVDAGQTTEMQLADKVQLAVVDDEDGRLGQALITAIQKAFPNAILHPIGLTPEAVTVMHTGEPSPPLAEILANSQIIVGPWTMVTPYVNHGITDPNTLAAIAASPAQKLLIPKPELNWDWAGFSGWETETAVQQTIRSVKRLISGQPVIEKKRYGLGTAVAIGFGIFALLNLAPLLLLIPLYIFGGF